MSVALTNSRPALRKERLPQHGERAVALYVRNTREENRKGLSPAAQKENGTAYAKLAGLSPLVVYEEPYAVGGDVPFEKREAGRRLVADIRAGKVAALLARDLDRLTRDVPLWLQLHQLCVDHDVVVHTLSGVLAVKSPSDRFANLVRAGAAQLEREQVGDRVRRVKRAIAQAGRHVGGPPPFGYTSQARLQQELRASGLTDEEARMRAETELPLRGHLYIDENEAKVVRLVIDWYVNRRWGCRRICNELNARGYRRRSGLLWHPDKLRRIINDPVIAGFIPVDEARFNDGRSRTPRQLQALHPGKHDPIVPVDLWRRAQDIKRANTCLHLGKGHAAYGSRKYCLSGILTCSCGSRATARGARADKPFGYYLCVKRKAAGPRAVNGCSASPLNTDKVHAAFWSKLAELLAGPGLVDRVYDAAQELLKRSTTAAADEAAAGREAGDLRRQLDLWSRRHADADPDSPQEAEAAAQVRELKQRLKRLRDEAAKASPPPAAARPVSDSCTRERVAQYLNGLGALMAASDDKGKALVQSLVQNHDLTVSIVDHQTLRLSLRLRPPGTAGGAEEFVVPIEGDARLQSDRITVWMEAQQAKAPMCACGCGRPVQIRRRHFWLGVPEFRSDCRHKGMARRRWKLAEGLYTGQRVATLLGIGRTTVNRWIKSGKLPKPQRSISKMLLFDRGVIDQLVAERNSAAAPYSDD